MNKTITIIDNQTTLLCDGEVLSVRIRMPSALHKLLIPAVQEVPTYPRRYGSTVQDTAAHNHFTENGDKCLRGGCVARYPPRSRAVGIKGIVWERLNSFRTTERHQASSKAAIAGNALVDRSSDDVPPLTIADLSDGVPQILSPSRKTLGSDIRQ